MRPPLSRRVLLSTFVASLAIGLPAGCANRSAAQRDPRLDRTLNLTTYYEEGKLAFLGVDTRPASLIRQGTMLPLPMALANRTKHSIHLATEDFTLRDDAGNLYPLVSYEEYRRDYRRFAADMKLAEPFYEATNVHLGLVGPGDPPYRPEPLPFFGNEGLRRDSLELGSFYFTRGILYFPVPPGGLKRRVFELHVSSRDLPEGIFVRFQVP